MAGQGKGMYELKSEFYARFNPFFYHFTRQEQSVAMEKQRTRRKQAKEEQVLTPPVPPPFTANYAYITRLLNCDVMHDMMCLVLNRGLVKWHRFWSETQYEKVSSLWLSRLSNSQECFSKYFSRCSDIVFDWLRAARRATSSEERELGSNARVELRAARTTNAK